MSPPRKASHQKRGQDAGHQLVTGLLDALRAGGRLMMEFGRDLSQLLLRPTDAITRLGKRKNWNFIIAGFSCFVLVMQLWSRLALYRFAPESFELKEALADSFGQTLAVWIIFPLAMLFTTWAGLALINQPVKLIQASMLVVITVIPLMAGCVLAGFLLDLGLGHTLFYATLIFSLLTSLGYFSEALQLLRGLGRSPRIYLPPLVYAVAYLAIQLLLALLFSEPAS